MSKLLSSVLEKVSENNNDYRIELKSLNKLIDEKTTALVGDVVTLSNYTVDFSNAVTMAKEVVINPISRAVESYVIKDLRSVETVNEQFVDKINDKIENANITSEEEKDNFISNLNSLLNDKYLEIVRIKRVDFVSLDGTNVDIEKVVLDFSNYLNETFKFSSEKLNEILNAYKKDIYELIANCLNKISNLYLNNFVSEISSALSATFDFEYSASANNDEDFKPYIPEIPSIPEIELENSNDVPTVPVDLPSENTLDDINIPPVPGFDNNENDGDNEYEQNYHAIEDEISDDAIDFEQATYEQENADEVTPLSTPMDVPSVTPITPIEVIEEPKQTIKKTYDVEEILKIAKSPVVTMPNEVGSSNSNEYTVVDTITTEEKDIFNAEFDEKEIVEEMIARLTKRLSAINERQALYDEEKAKIEDDEKFVNDLIENSNSKKQELDKLEEELDNKQKELEEKRVELDKKLNDVLPLANAIMKEEK